MIDREPGWFARELTKIKHDASQRQLYDQCDQEAIAMLRSAQSPLAEAPRYQINRSINYLRDRDFAIESYCVEGLQKSIIQRRARHAAVCNCGASV